MAKFERELRAKASEVAKYLNAGIKDSASGVELIDSSAYRQENSSAYFMMYDKCYTRSSIRTALSVLVIGSDDGDCIVSAISSGSGNGILINFSWGSEEDFVSVVEKLMDSFGKKNISD